MVVAGAAGRLAAANYREPQFEARQQQILNCFVFICHLFRKDAFSDLFPSYFFLFGVYAEAGIDLWRAILCKQHSLLSGGMI